MTSAAGGAASVWVVGMPDPTSAFLCTNRLVFVPTDTLLKRNETRRGDKDLLSL